MVLELGLISKKNESIFMKKIEILKLSPYYYPERISSSHLTEDLDEAFMLANFHTTVISPSPCRGIDQKTRNQYKRIKHETLKNGSIDLYRFSLFREGKRTIVRAARYVLCNLIQYFKGIKIKGIDIVFAGSTPPTQGVLCGRVAKKLSKKYGYKVPFIYNLQDVFPDSLVNSGMTKRGSIIWKIGRIIENRTYKYADKIIVISEGLKQNIMSKGVSEDKIIVISNWIDLDIIKPVTKEENKLFDELNLDSSKFIVVYAGNIGDVQGVDVIIDAAKQLKKYVDIQFVIIGGGIKYRSIEKRIKSESVTNIFITELLTKERIPEVYSLGDVALITCKSGTGNAGMPSKTWSIMACNTSIIASFDTNSDLSDVLKQSGAGICVEPEDPKALSKAIITKYNDWKGNKNVQVDLRKYVFEYASKDTCVSKYIDTIKSMANIC